MLEWLQQVDTSIFLTLNGLHTTFFDRFMMLATGRFTWIPFYLALAAMLWLRYGTKRTLLILVSVAVVITLADQVCASWLRPIFKRLRPAHPDNPLSPLVLIVDGYRGGHYGFPSSHGANAFALALFLTLVCRRALLTWTLYIWAALHVYTRIYLGVHYIGDITVGAVLGSAVALLIYLLYKRLSPRVPATPPSPARKPGFEPAWIPLGVFVAEVLTLALMSL